MSYMFVMLKFTSVILVVISLINLSFESVEDNLVETENAYADVAQSLFQENGPDLTGLVSSFMSSEGGKQLGDMLVKSVQSGSAGGILQGLGGMLGQNAAGGAGGLNLEMMGSILSMLNSNSDNDNGPKSSQKEGFDLSSALNLANSFMGQEGSKDMVSYLPLILNLFSAFYGPEAEKTAHEHAGHAWYLPPVLEKLHIIFDQFMHSDLAKDIIKNVGGESFVKVFSDDSGHFDYKKFVQLLENQSFRRYWLKMVTGRLAEILSYFSDPHTQRKILSTITFFTNNFLKGQGVPKNALYDPARPADSLVNLANYVPKRMFNFKFDSTPYVRPAVEYVQDLFKMAENMGFVGKAIGSTELTHKLTDTINLEMIEPFARVNRAIRLAKKVPSCTRYVLCIVNEPSDMVVDSLPGLRTSLNKAATLGASWYLGPKINDQFWTVYNDVSEGKHCKKYYNEACNEFHVEESKSTEEYVHNEL